MSAMKPVQGDTLKYADPAEPDLTCRFILRTQEKSIGDIRATNHRTEIVINDDNTVTVGSESGVEALSIRVAISGSAHSEARLKSLIALLGSQLVTWGNEGVFTGFNPTTAPNFTVV